MATEEGIDMRVRALLLLTTFAFPGIGFGADPGCVPDATNVAKCAPYSIVPTPNYFHPDGVSHESDDCDLTDGVYVAAVHWSELAVTWRDHPAIRIELDLGRPLCGSDPLECHAISEIELQVQDRKGTAGIWCPASALFEVSDNGIDYYRVANWETPLGYPTEDCGPVGPAPLVNNFLISSGALETRGTHVRVTVFPPFEPGRFVFMDEIEVRVGAHSATSTNYLSDPVSEYEAALDALGPSWQLFEVEPLAAIGPSSLPAAGTPPTETLVIHAAGGENAISALLLTHPDVVDQTFAVSLTDLTGSAGVIPAGSIALRQGFDVLTSTFETRSDALALLGGSESLHARARSTSNVWIEVAVPAGTAAGVYEGLLGFTRESDFEVQSVALQVEVRGFDLPALRAIPFALHDWSNSIPSGSANPLATGQNDDRASIRAWGGQNVHLTYHAPGPTTGDGHVTATDLAYLGEEVARYPDAQSHVLYLGSNQRRGPGLCYGTPGWSLAVQNWLGDISSYLQGRGLTKSEFVFYMIDEPSSGSTLFVGPAECVLEVNRLEYALATATAIKGLDPELQVYMNSGEMDEALLTPFIGLVDIWAPNLVRFNGDHPALEAFYAARQEAGDSLWTYNGVKFNHTDGHPYTDARVHAWSMWNGGFDGYGYWSLYAPALESGVPTSSWNAHDGLDADWSTLYLANHADAPALLPQIEALVPSRRAGGLRRGMEDLRYLALLQQRIEAFSPSFDVSNQEATLAAELSAVTNGAGDLAVAEGALSVVATAIDTLGDDDLDGFPAFADNCPADDNPGQADTDGDGIGDLCDPLPVPLGGGPLVFVLGGLLLGAGSLRLARNG